jgi:hypothetical protein
MAPTAIKSPTDMVDFLVSQHQQIKALFAETLAASGTARSKAFVEVRRLLAAHETAEEEIVHPRAKCKISDGATVVDERLHEEHQLAEAVAPTRPHAGVESQVATLAAGPFAAMLDRAATRSSARASVRNDGGAPRLTGAPAGRQF